MPREGAGAARGVSGAEAEAARQRTGQRPRGRVPQPVDETPEDQAPSPWTDPERPSMRSNHSRDTRIVQTLTQTKAIQRF